jgi:hypothetical protein
MPLYGPFDHVISLGRDCMPAHQIRRVLGVSLASVFDWVVTPEHALIYSIKSGLVGFFDLADMVRGANGRVINTQSEVRFIHEFSDTGDIAVQHAQHVGRNTRLVQRWRILTQSNASVLFVRYDAKCRNPHAASIMLRDLLREKAPRLSFHLLYVVDPSFDLPDENGISFRRMRPNPLATWEGDNEQWSDILTAATTT